MDDPDLGAQRLAEIVRESFAPIVAIVVVLVGTVVFLDLVVRTPLYRSETVVLFSKPFSSGFGAGTDSDADRSMLNELEVAESRPVVGVIEDLYGDEVRIGAELESGRDVLTFTAADPDADVAAEIADAYAATFLDIRETAILDEFLDAAEAVQRRIDVIDASLASLGDDPLSAAEVTERDLFLAQRSLLLERLEDVALNSELVSAGSARIVSPAEAGEEPVSPSPIRDALVAAVAGLVIGVGFVYVWWIFKNHDRRVRTVRDVEALGLQVLAAIPRVKERMGKNRVAVLALEDAEHPVSIAYHRLRTVLEFSSSTRHLTSLLVTSPSQSEGKTTTAVNLAGSLALGGDFTAVVEADLRRPRFAEVYGIPHNIGVTSYLAGKIEFENLGGHPTADDHLVVVPAGPLPATATSAISDPAFKYMLELIEKDSDVVVIDSPPVLPVPDAQDLAHMVDGVLLVARAGVTKSSELLLAHESLTRVSANVLGVVLTLTKDKTVPYRYEVEEPSKGLMKPVQWIRSKLQLGGRALFR